MHCFFLRYVKFFKLHRDIIHSCLVWKQNSWLLPSGPWLDPLLCPAPDRPRPAPVNVQPDCPEMSSLRLASSLPRVDLRLSLFSSADVRWAVIPRADDRSRLHSPRAPLSLPSPHAPTPTNCQWSAEWANLCGAGHIPTTPSISLCRELFTTFLHCIYVIFHISN